MKNYLTVAFTMLIITVFGQIKTVEIASHYEAGTSLNEYKIEENITQDVNGGYGFKLKTPSDFTSFALGWMSSTQNYAAGTFQIVYKVHKPGKGWSTWKTDEGFTNPSDTRSGFYKSNLMFGFDEFLHDSIEFYIHAPEGEVITELYLITQDISQSIDIDAVVKTEETNGSKACPELPAIIPRSEWCGSYDACHNPTYTVVYRTPTHSVVHHGASPDSYTDGYAVVRSYWNYHVNSNGWSDIGYNYLFDKYGNLFQGRHNPNMPNQDVNAAHAGSANPYSIGLNFLGNSDAVNTAPTTAQLQKCSEFLAWWYDYKGFDPLSSASVINQLGNTVTLPRICGHKDINPGGTTCPGTALYALIPDIKTNTNQIIVDCTTPTDVEAPTTSITTNRDWYNSNFDVSFSDADNAGGTGVKHSFYQIMDFDGTEWRANGNNGYFNDNFTTAIHSDWTSISGTWSISANHLLQANEALTNTNIYANVTQESGGVYLYHWQQKTSGAGANKRSGMHFFCSDPTGDGRGNSYMVYLRADGNTVQLYEYDNNSYSNPNGWLITEAYTIDPNIWYDVKVILNNSTGEISVYIDNNLVAITIDPTPLTSGIAISPRTGECQTEYDDIKVYKVRDNTINVLPEEYSLADIRYQSPTHNQEAGRIRTVLVDNAANWSESISKNVFTDFDAPDTEINFNSSTWYSDDFVVNFNDTDILSGIEKRFYTVNDNSGTSFSANQNRGFAFNDFSSASTSGWTSQVGTWSAASGSLVQSSEVETNTNIWSYLQQDLSNRYLYEFDMNISGSNANKRAGFHFFSDDPTLTNRGNGYFVWFRLSTQDLEFYKVTDDVFSLEKYYDINISAATWYNIKIIYDRITGETFVYMDDVLVGEYKDDQPYSTGNYISFRSGNGILNVDNLKIYRTRNATATLTAGTASDDIRYQSPSSSSAAANIWSIVTDSAKNISQPFGTEVFADWTQPSAIATVNDGPASDIDNTILLYQLSGNWSASTDANSGILAYYYAIGTSLGGTQLVNWTNNGTSLNFIQNSLSLVAGTTYYISIKSENGAGIFSSVTSSDGVLAEIVPVCPAISSVCIDEPAFTLSGATPIGGVYSGNGVSAGIFNPATAGEGSHTITYTYGTQFCTFEIVVNPLPIVACPENIYVALNASSFTLSGAFPAGGEFSISGTPLVSFNPSTFGVGDYEVTYTYTSLDTECINFCTFFIYVYEPTVVSCPEDFAVCQYFSDFDLEGATPPGGEYSIDGEIVSVFQPNYWGIGEHTVTYTFETLTCQYLLTVNAEPEVICPANISVTTADDAFPLSGGIPVGGIYTIGGNETTNFDPDLFGEGIFTVNYTYQDPLTNCEDNCLFSITVTPYVSIEQDYANAFEIYPNPAKEELFIKYNFQSESLFKLYDILGSEVISLKLGAGSNSIPVSLNELNSGMYLFDITDINGKRIKTGKLIIQ
jgi:hypothetical protein